MIKRNSLAILVVFAEIEKLDHYIFFLAKQIGLTVQRMCITVNGKLYGDALK